MSDEFDGIALLDLRLRYLSILNERDEARRVARQWYRTAHGEHEMVLFYQNEMIAAKQERDAFQKRASQYYEAWDKEKNRVIDLLKENSVLTLELDAANRMAAGWLDSPEYKAYIERINERGVPNDIIAENKELVQRVADLEEATNWTIGYLGAIEYLDKDAIEMAINRLLDAVNADD